MLVVQFRELVHRFVFDHRQAVPRKRLASSRRVRALRPGLGIVSRLSKGRVHLHQTQLPVSTPGEEEKASRGRRLAEQIKEIRFGDETEINDRRRSVGDDAVGQRSQVLIFIATPTNEAEGRRTRVSSGADEEIVVHRAANLPQTR